MVENLVYSIINVNSIKVNIEENVANELSLFFINSNLSGEQRIELLKIISKLKKNEE